MSERYEGKSGRLLRLGPASRGEWLDYKALVGLSRDDVADLTRMVRDPTLHQAPTASAEAWAPVHAWRALAQLEAVDVFEAMLPVIEHGLSDMAMFEFANVAKHFGPTAIPSLQHILVDGSRHESHRIAAANALAQVAANDTGSRRQVVDVLVTQLNQSTADALTLNAAIVQGLLDLRVGEALPVIENAFAQQRIDLDLVTWDDVSSVFGPHA